jgi:hypothetical protein
MASVTGGGRLDAALGAIAAKLGGASEVQIGFLGNATYPDGTSVALVAFINEYGRSKIGQPPRPFFRNMIAAKSPEWPKAIAGLLKATDYDGASTLNQTGAAIKGQLQQSITDLTSPPLKQSTIDRKGFDKPLIDTGHMQNSVDYIVK